MYTITKLKMWRDPGYTRECVEIPPAGSVKLPAADYSSTASIRPRKSEIWGELQLPLSFVTCCDMSYIYFEAEDGATPNPNTLKMYGWITDVREIASAGEACSIMWTPDWWRTCSGLVAFGSGNVSRCADGSYKRPCPTQPRKWVVNKREELFPKPADAAALADYVPIIVYATVDSDDKPTRIDYLYWRTSYSLGETIGAYATPSLMDVYASSFYGDLALSPTNVIGIYLSPIEPWEKNASYVYSGGSKRAYRRPEVYVNPGYGNNHYIDGAKKEQTLYSEFTSDDTHKTVIMDPLGTIVATVPWGRTVKSIKGVCDIGTTEGNLVLNLLAANETVDGVVSAAEGYRVTIPMLNIPVNASGWDSYVLSGQRSYDRRNAEIQRNQSLVSGLTGIGTGAAGGAIGSSMAGKGLGVGALVGAGASAAGAAGGYLAAGFFNDQLQNEKDKLVSNQAANVIVNGGGDNWIVEEGYNPAHWYIVELVMDSVSQDEYDNNIAVNGYPVDMPFTDISTLVAAGGPLQVSDLMITGAVPAQAKTYIKNILSNGVRIVENNPTGSDPGA